jgi:hypothetical protein
VKISRLHDNPALLEALRSNGAQKTTFYPVFIFDGCSAGEHEKLIINKSHTLIAVRITITEKNS